VNRVAAIVVTLAVVAGSVPAAATLGTGAQTGTTASGVEPGATFAGVIGVQEAEVDSEVAERALSRQFGAAETNGSKARVVAEQQEQLDERLDRLEAEKARLDRAYENGSIGQGQYQARLAALAAEIRALERRANRTATVAESLPAEALREHGANVSRVRSIAQQANRTGGGEVAEAARKIAGESVGNGLGPPNGSERGPPDRAGPNDNGTDAGNGQRPNGTGPNGGAGQAPNGTGQGNATDRPSANAAGGNGSAGGAANGTAGPSNGVGDGQNTANGRNTTGTDPGGEPDRNAGNDTADVTNRTAGNTTGQGPGNASGTNGDGAAGNTTNGDGANGDGAAGNTTNGDGTDDESREGTPTPTATRTA
jgi:hypothetical protein